jgi:hypothetical protein
MPLQVSEHKAELARQAGELGEQRAEVERQGGQVRPRC